jgi:hypothetical protein
MKIISRKEFMKMPIGTIFSYYEPSCFRELMVKASDLTEWENDFLYDNIIGAIKTVSSEAFSVKCDLMEVGESVSMDFEKTLREGLFDEDQLFAIYEKEDVGKLIKRLQESLNKLLPTDNK